MVWKVWIVIILFRLSDYHLRIYLASQLNYESLKVYNYMDLRPFFQILMIVLQIRVKMAEAAVME